MKVNLDLFDTWLDEHLYIKQKGQRKQIITLYKKALKEEYRLSQFKKELNDIGLEDMTIENIINYLIWKEGAHER